MTPEASIVQCRSRKVVSLKFFVPTFGLSYSHPLRKAWRGFGLDPLVDNALRVVSVASAVMVVIIFLWAQSASAGTVPIRATDAYWACVAVMFCTMVAGVTWAMSVGHPSFPLKLQELQADLDVPIEKYSLTDLKGLASTSLARLACFVKKAERAEPNPYHAFREEAKEDFKEKYHLYLMFGLIEDVGYGHFFNIKQEFDH